MLNLLLRSSEIIVPELVHLRSDGRAADSSSGAQFVFVRRHEVILVMSRPELQ